MDLRTFLKPEALPLQEIPAVGDPAPNLPGMAPSPTLIAFLRHVGCPMAEAVFRGMRTSAERATDVHHVIVSHGSETETTRWSQALGGLGDLRRLDDPKRQLYARWGLGLTRAAHFLGPRSLLGVLRLALRGTFNRHPSGSRWQRAGTFAVDSGGHVAWHHLPAHAADLPDLESALHTLRTRR